MKKSLFKVNNKPAIYMDIILVLLFIKNLNMYLFT